MLAPDAPLVIQQLNAAAAAVHDLDVYAGSLAAVQTQFTDSTGDLTLGIDQVNQAFAQLFYAAKAHGVIWRLGLRPIVITAVYGSIQTVASQFPAVTQEIAAVQAAITAQGGKASAAQTASVISALQALQKLFSQIQSNVNSAVSEMSTLSEELTTDYRNLTQGNTTLPFILANLQNSAQSLIEQYSGLGGGGLVNFIEQVFGAWNSGFTNVQTALPSLETGNANSTQAITGLQTAWTGLAGDAAAVISLLQSATSQNAGSTVQGVLINAANTVWQDLAKTAAGLQPPPAPSLHPTS